MDIKKEGKNLVIVLPLMQESYNDLNEPIGEISNIIGMICGEEWGIAGVIDLGYKGSLDYTDFIIHLEEYYKLKEFKRLCNEDWGIGYFEWPVCGVCHKVMYGIFTMNKDGKECHEECKEK